MKFNLIKQVSFIDENINSSKIYNESKIHIMPTITTPDSVEGFGISNIEAAAFGLPCIVSDSGGTPESINKNGKIVKENNLEDLTKGIIDVMNNLDKLSKKSHQLAKKFENTKKIKEYLIVFKTDSKLVLSSSPGLSCINLVTFKFFDKIIDLINRFPIKLFS
jgi:glycosyltransferase involved in cell wall biosynthesis